MFLVIWGERKFNEKCSFCGDTSLTCVGGTDSILFPLYCPLGQEVVARVTIDAPLKFIAL